MSVTHSSSHFVILFRTTNYHFFSTLRRATGMDHSNYFLLLMCCYLAISALPSLSCSLFFMNVNGVLNHLMDACLLRDRKVEHDQRSETKNKNYAGWCVEFCLTIDKNWRRNTKLVYATFFSTQFIEWTDWLTITSRLAKERVRYMKQWLFTTQNPPRSSVSVPLRERRMKICLLSWDTSSRLLF